MYLFIHFCSKFIINRIICHIFKCYFIYENRIQNKNLYNLYIYILKFTNYSILVTIQYYFLLIIKFNLHYI